MRTVVTLDERIAQMTYGVKDALLYLADSAQLSRPDVLVEISSLPIKQPHYRDTKLFLPQSFVHRLFALPKPPCEQKQRTRRWEKQVVNFYVQPTLHPTDKPQGQSMPVLSEQARHCYLFGQLAGLVLQRRTNPSFGELFDKVSLAEREQLPLYELLTAFAGTTAGLLALSRYPPSGQSLACAKAQVFRQVVNDETLYVDSIGRDYAAQVFLKYGGSRLVDVLTAASVADAHKLVVPNEQFHEFTITKRWNAPTKSD